MGRRDFTSSRSARKSRLPSISRSDPCRAAKALRRVGFDSSIVKIPAMMRRTWALKRSLLASTNTSFPSVGGVLASEPLTDEELPELSIQKKKKLLLLKLKFLKP